MIIKNIITIDHERTHLSVLFEMKAGLLELFLCQVLYITVSNGYT